MQDRPTERPPAGGLGRFGIVLRLTVTAVFLGILLTAQLGRHDDWFPLGMLGQYGVARDPDGVVLDTYLVGRFTDGRTARIEMRADTVGMTRVEMEVALPELEQDPSRLALLEATYEAQHPGTDLAALEIRQQVHRLRDGAQHGPVEDRLVLAWTGETG